MTAPPLGRASSKKALIAAHLRKLIAEGKVEPDGRLPTERDLEDLFEVTRATVRAGYNVLIHEGLVTARIREGYFVRQVPEITWRMTERDSVARSHVFPVDPWLSAIQEAGFVGRQHITVRIIPGDRTIDGTSLADLLAVGPSGLVVCRSRIRYISSNGGAAWHPQELADSYYPYDVVRDTPLVYEDDVQPSTYAVFDGIGHARRGFDDRSSARMPTEAEATKLELPPGTPVMEIVRTATFEPDGECLLVRHSILGPGNYLLYQMGA